VVIAAGVLGAWLVSAALPVVAQPRAPVLHDIQSVSDLRFAFERDGGMIRVVLLLSPT
jgi:hypothetical protein